MSTETIGALTVRVAKSGLVLIHKVTFELPNGSKMPVVIDAPEIEQK